MIKLYFTMHLILSSEISAAAQSTLLKTFQNSSQRLSGYMTHDHKITLLFGSWFVFHCFIVSFYGMKNPSYI